MTQIADPLWDEYARLQRMLNARRIVDDISSGIEAALDFLVSTASAAPSGEPSFLLAQRAQASAMRRQRRRRGILAQEESRLLDLNRVEADRSAEAQPLARMEVARIFDVLNEGDRKVLIALAQGGDVAAASGLAPTTFRKRLQRMRDRLAA